MGTKSVELSALREHELGPLMTALGDLDLGEFEYVSVHAPSKFKTLTEAAAAELLQPCIERKLPIVLHPDAIHDPSSWQQFGQLLCIENMDKRKPTGRTMSEMDAFFARFPAATWCFDIAHARQIDSTMSEARSMLKRFGSRLCQVHISEVNDRGHHDPLSAATVRATQMVAALIDPGTPIIIESMIPEADIEREIGSVTRALTSVALPADNEPLDWGELA
jgi:hypothetical protein